MKSNDVNIVGVDNKFSVNQRFEFLAKFTRMVANKEANSLIVLGEGGLGKTFTVNQTLKTCNLKPDEIYIAKGFTTSRGLYELLYDNNGKLIVFDDFDSVFDKADSINILKAALDSYDHRYITWGSKATNSDKYPKHFEFTGRIIFISNRSRNSISGPVLDRAFKVDLEMNNNEKIERMKGIVEDLCKRNNFDYVEGLVAIGFLEEYKDRAKKLSIRTLLDVMRIIKNTTGDWKSLAEYTVLEGQR